MAGPAPAVETRLGHYRLTEKIGAGGMGVVYRARDEHLDRDVAIKILPPGRLADEAAHKRFRKEALALSKLNHPNVATVHDFTTEGSTDFLVMEYITGSVVSQMLVKGALPEKEVARLGTQLVDGLEAAHEHGVIHRDLKPANLRVTPEGRLKILDFGLAQSFRAADTDVTASGAESQAGIAGTLPYMAPEQVCNEELDARTDIWAAGVVLYEMATGQLPFPERGVKVVDSILHAAPPAPAALKPRLSPALSAIILKCLEKDPESRYQSAKELLVDLHRLRAPSTLATAAVRPQHRPTLRPWHLVAGSALLLVSVLFAIPGIRQQVKALVSTPPPINSLAVMPLAPLSHSPDQEVFAEELTSELITTLAKVGALHVLQYRGPSASFKEIAKRSNVGAVLAGDVAQSGNRVRITVKLIHANTEQILWSNDYIRDLGDVLVLQADIALAIAQEIRLQLTPQDRDRLQGNRPVNPAAYEAYLKGRYYISRYTKAGTDVGLQHLKEAIALDPSFALPYDGIAGYYFAAAEYYLPMSVSMQKAKEAAEQAASLDSTIAEPHNSLGIVHYWSWDWRAAEEEFHRALALNPNYAPAHSYLGWTYATQGRFDEAYAEIKRGHDLDPLSPDLSAFVPWLLYFMGQYDEAARLMEALVNKDPGFLPAHMYLAHAYEQQGKFADAIRKFEEARHLAEEGGAGTEASIPELIGALGRSRALNGDKREAHQLLAELGAMRKHKYVSAYPEAWIYAALGDKEKALDRLEQAYRDRSFYITWLAIDPAFKSLHTEARFQQLLHGAQLAK